MKIRIQNFQSLGQAELEAEGLTVLVGKSNLGKSATVRAVEGALFNRTGEFVREGEKIATVAVEALPGVHGTLDVVWEKGGSVNRYTVNGSRYDKVGQAAPAPVEEAGYRDVRVGSELLRPQVSGQFDPLFLLTRPGSFVSDVLTIISRLGVLLAADRACTKDLKGAKGTLSIKADDLRGAEAKLAVLQPVADLHARVTALEGEVKAMLALADRVEQVAALRRDQLALTVVARQKLPAVVPVSETLGIREVEARRLAELRRRIAFVEGQELPVTPPEVYWQEVDNAGKRVVTGLLLAEMRRRAVSVVDLKLPKALPMTRKLGEMDKAMAMAQEVRGLLTAQQAGVRAMTEATSTAKAMVVEAEAVEKELAQLYDTMVVCPICDRPMERRHAQ